MTELVKVHRIVQAQEVGDTPELQRMFRGMDFFERDERALRHPDAGNWRGCIWGKRGCPQDTPVLCLTCVEIGVAKRKLAARDVRSERERAA